MPVPVTERPAVAAQLITVKPTKFATWPTTGLVQLGAPEGDFRPTREVFLNAEPIGKIVVLKGHTPSRNIPGTRLRRDLKPRNVWRVWTGPGRDSRIDYVTRGEAVAAVLQNHLSPKVNA